MNVAIFGGTGFVGNYILKELENNSYSPQILVRRGSETKINPSKNYTIILGDIFDEVANIINWAYHLMIYYQKITVH